MKTRKHISKNAILLIWMMGVSFFSFGQLSAPNVEEVFGGRINAITGYSKTSDTTRLFISTESANSIFYSDIYNPAGAGFRFKKFKSLKSADASKNLGGTIRTMAIHNASGKLFFSTGGSGLYVTHPDSMNSTLIDAGAVNWVKIKDSVLIYLKGNQLCYGILDANGIYIKSSSSPKFLAGPMAPSSFDIHPSTFLIYLFYKGTTPSLSKSNLTFYNLGTSLSFSSISMGTLPSNKEFTGFGISPSGRLFLGGYGNPLSPGKIFRYTDNEITWFTSTPIMGGVSSEVFAFSGSSSSYRTYFANGYSTDQGSTWLSFGNTFQETHPNDGAVFSDPNDTNTVYLTSDLALAVSRNGGDSMYDIERGIEAVQVRDFDMTSDKQTAWIASKAGIRKVSNYQSTPVWTRPMFPNNDGSPYYSAAMSTGDTNTVYVGNLRIYKTNSGGKHWIQVFTPESAPYNFQGVGTIANAIEVCQFDTNIVFAGFEIQDTAKGGLFYSLNAGNSWSQLLLEASSVGQDVDVTDIAFNIEGTDTVAYASVRYDLSKPQGRSIYRIVKSGSTWTPSQNMNATNTSTSSLIVATIEDIHVSYTGDTLYAVGTDAGINHPICYYKPISSTNKWTPMTTSGFPFVTGKKGNAVSLGVDTVFCAVDNVIYMYIWGSSSWTMGYAYPNGTEIHFLYYDELLAGTSTGLYGHVGVGAPVNPCTPTFKNQNIQICEGNTFVFNNKSYSQPGVYLDSLKTLLGCDSIIITNLQVNLRSYFQNIVSLCAGKTYSINGHTYSISGTYKDTLLGSKGCDSIVTTLLTINPLVQTAISASICNGEIFTYHGKNYQVQGNYLDTIKSMNACDTLVNISIKILPNYSLNESIQICKNGEYQYPDGTIGKQSEVHVSKLKTKAGCDSSITTALVLNTINTQVILAGTTLSSEEVNAQYQWFVCGSTPTLINGAINKDYVATETGEYGVIISKNDCIDTSTCYAVSVTGIDELLAQTFSIFPNPANTTINLNYKGKMKVIIMDIQGSVIGNYLMENQLEVNVSDLKSGVYQLLLVDEIKGTSLSKRFMKQ
ncbi:MAG: T9SS type A sorting domain-containing protein [Bacteroidia bacterium]|nr:T9SS type A sorting domain-containing protein [Bacteroidia bacterium]MCF8425449.1 T9SS type A sorting domain-containing protein [Bacteroidia bacterium]MCF8446269.1 T9SS type A sorting domain-containing protein [Bacteroidia bacterium]